MKIKIPKILKILFKPIGFLLKPFKILFKPVIFIYNNIMDKVRKSIRAELVLVFVICLLASFMIFGIANSYMRTNNKYARIDYGEGIGSISSISTSFVDQINYGKFNIGDKDKIMNLINSRANEYEDIKILVLDLDGKVLYKSSNVSETQVDVYNLIKNVLAPKGKSYQYDDRTVPVEEQRKEYVSFYPLQFNDSRAYVVVKGIPEGHIIYYESSGNSFVALLIACASFIFIFLLITKGRMIYFEELAKGIIEISKGNLNYRAKKVGEDELATFADSINHMAAELQNQIEAERRAERTKNELITNVSHDLRTPLTSIMGYLGLIKQEKYTSKEEMNEYVTISYSKSEKLKVLIEDLFEYTKLSSEGIKLNKRSVLISEFLDQLIEELVPIFEENQITVTKDFSNEKIFLDVDVDKILRVFENLFMNAIKYSYKPGEVKVKIYKDKNDVIICVQNNGDNISGEEITKIFDRFYRLEKSRSSATGGSGLGLAIAKNIVELHNGEIWAESKENIISFYVKLKNE